MNYYKYVSKVYNNAPEDIVQMLIDRIDYKIAKLSEIQDRR